jgi:hypothetical protein
MLITYIYPEKNLNGMHQRLIYADNVSIREKHKYINTKKQMLLWIV